MTKTESQMTLDNWWNGMATNADANGSFVYGENIDFRTDAKRIKLSPALGRWTVFTWTNTIQDIFYQNWLLWYVTSDWYIWETNEYYPLWIFTDRWWAVYKTPTASWYLASEVVWDNLVCIRSDKIDRIIWFPSIFWTTVVSNPSLTNDADWTVWTWWTTWVSWATHTSWVDTLRQILTLEASSKYRIVVRVSWVTTGTCEVRLWTQVLWTISSTTDTWFMNVWITGVWDTSLNITFIPTTWFNWTISYVWVYKYDTDKIKIDEITLTSSTKKFVAKKQWLMYITAWNKIDVIDTNIWALDQTVTLVDEWFNIMWIHSVWDNFIIFATDNRDTIQYYWNWVDEFASERVLWRWVSCISTIQNWASTYVTIYDWKNTALYEVSWYTRTLIFKSQTNITQTSKLQFTKERNKYRLLDTRYTTNWSIMDMEWDMLFVAAHDLWLYTYWTALPNQTKTVVKEWLVSWLTTTVKLIKNPGIWVCVSNSITSWGKVNCTLWVFNTNVVNTGVYWEIVTKPIVWDKLSKEKYFTKMKIWYILPETTSKIELWLRSDNYQYQTFWVSWVMTTPSIWDVYKVSSSGTERMTVISTNITGWVWTITCTATDTAWFANLITTVSNIRKVSWDWDSLITVTDHDWYIKVDEITTTWYYMWYRTLFNKTFGDLYNHDWHKVQLKRKLYTEATNSTWWPEIYDVNILSDYIQQDAG